MLLSMNSNIPRATGGSEGPDRIFVGGLPYYFTEIQIRELLESFGPLRGFDLVKDMVSVSTSGQAKSEQENMLSQAQQHIAIQKMVLQAGGVNLPAVGILPARTAEIPTKVLCLSEAVTADELRDDGEYEEILDNMREECGKFGALVNIVIPSPLANDDDSQGVGKVFLEYADLLGCANAKTSLHGRKFGGNTVSAVYFAEDKFHNADYSS